MGSQLQIERKVEPAEFPNQIKRALADLHPRHLAAISAKQLFTIRFRKPWNHCSGFASNDCSRGATAFRMSGALDSDFSWLRGVQRLAALAAYISLMLKSPLFMKGLQRANLQELVSLSSET